jgi:type IV pilus assembly protein PilB
MRDVLNVPTNFRNGMVSRIKLLCGMDIAERRRPQDGRLRLKTAQGVKDLRVSSVPTLYGENLVCRILSADASHISFDALGMPPEVEANLCRSLRQTSRVILVTGPTGSGKTSTLYAALRYLNDGTKNIITIEDPIEYRIAGLQQIQVNPKINFSFAEGLRSVLRQDPDIIMLGEIRDEETAQIAIQAAQTGHLVLATLHTNSAASAVQRLIDLKVPPFSVASALSTVLAQRLVRRLCPHCAQPVDPQHYAQLAALGLTLAQLHEPAGCSHCEQSGYIGRLAIYSLLEINDALRGAIRNQTSEMELEQLALGNGYQSLGQAAAELLEQGITSLAEIESKLGPIDSLLATGQPLNGQPAPQSGVSKHRVLLVEDDETTRYILAMLLRDQMYEVEEAADGKEALEAVYRQPPTLIVSDVMMPKLGGVELVKMLRNDKRTCNIPILMLTALDSEEKELQLIENGADDFVGKTADTRLFLARVQRLLQRSSEGA